MDQPSTNIPNAQDDLGLDDLLRSAKVEVPLPGTFQAEVWRRIAVAQEATFSARLAQWTESVFGALVRPAWAAAAVAVMASTGAWLGLKGPGDTSTDGRVAYVQSVSPFAHSHRGQGGHQ